MLFFEVIKNIFRFTPDHQNELTTAVATLEAEKKSSSKEVEILKSRVSVLERQNSSLWTQVTEKEKRLGEANTEIALMKQQQSQEKALTRSQVNSLQSQNTSLLTEVGEKTTALFQAKCESVLVKSNEANLQKQCEELKMQKKELEDRATFNNNMEKVKVEPTVNIKPEPEIERKVKEDNIKDKVEFTRESAKDDKRPRTLGVFGLGPFIREEDLIKEFNVFGGLVGATIVKDHITGSSKGYGFVKFLDPEDAERARGIMDNQSIFGRKVQVNYSYRETGSGTRTPDSRIFKDYDTFDYDNYNPGNRRNKRVYNGRMNRSYNPEPKRYKPYDYYLDNSYKYY